MFDFQKWEGFCLAAEDTSLFPDGSIPCEGPFSPLVILIRRDPMTSRGLFAVRSLAELRENESVCCLEPLEAPAEPEDSLDAFLRMKGATVLNTSFGRAFPYLRAFYSRRRAGLKLTLVGLGDVGGTVLTGLKLLGRELSEISVFDMNPAMCSRYELELNQVIPDEDGRVMPKVTVCPQEKLYDCDALLFTASRGVPGLDSGVKDVRMVQFDANKKMLDLYARWARDAAFTGFFFQISDPVDHLAREVFLASNRDENGVYDWNGLLPEQIQGFGLGVMSARAAYYADRNGIDFTSGRVYGPHGAGLIAANAPCEGYNDEVSQELTKLTREANLQVRALGFKPYIAPGLSSAAISVLRTLRSQIHYGTLPIDGAAFGCRSELTPQGFRPVREALHPVLKERIAEAHRALKEFQYE